MIENNLLTIPFINIMEDRCKPEHIDNYGNTALLLACSAGKSMIITRLMSLFGEKCLPGHCDGVGKTPLYNICNSSKMYYYLLIVTSLPNIFFIRDITIYYGNFIIKLTKQSFRSICGKVKNSDRMIVGFDKLS